MSLLQPGFVRTLRRVQTHSAKVRRSYEYETLTSRVPLCGPPYVKVGAIESWSWDLCVIYKDWKDVTDFTGRI